MDRKTYAKLSTNLLALAAKIEASKRPGYTGGSIDVLQNFKAVAQRTGLSVGQVWAVYFLKHVDAITTALTKPDLPISESLDGRFSDGINYLKLGWAIYTEEVHGTGEPAGR